MDLRRLSSSLLFRIVVAIISGIVCSLFFPDWLGRVFATFNGLFGNFLGFFIPVLIFALITPAIAGIGKGAGKWLAITTSPMLPLFSLDSWPIFPHPLSTHDYWQGKVWSLRRMWKKAP